jgi:hypothetical protein
VVCICLALLLGKHTTQPVSAQSDPLIADSSDYHLLDSRGNEATQVAIGELVRFQLQLRNNGTRIAPELSIAFILDPMTGRFVDHRGGVEASRYGFKGVTPFEPPDPGEAAVYVAEWRTSEPFFVANGVNWYVDPGRYEVVANWVPADWNFPNASDFQGWVTREVEVEFLRPPSDAPPWWAVGLIVAFVVAIPVAYVLINRRIRPTPRKKRTARETRRRKKSPRGRKR